MAVQPDAARRVQQTVRPHARQRTPAGPDGARVASSERAVGTARLRFCTVPRTAGVMPATRSPPSRHEPSMNSRPQRRTWAQPDGAGGCVGRPRCRRPWRHPHRPSYWPLPSSRREALLDRHLRGPSSRSRTPRRLRRALRRGVPLLGRALRGNEHRPPADAPHRRDRRGRQQRPALAFPLPVERLRNHQEREARCRHRRDRHRSQQGRGEAIGRVASHVPGALPLHRQRQRWRDDRVRESQVELLNARPAFTC
jgi:hypothetical protein